MAASCRVNCFGRSYHEVYFHQRYMQLFQMSQNTGNRGPLTSAAVALAVQLIDGWGHVAVADVFTLFTSITKGHEAWWHCRRLCEEKSCINKPMSCSCQQLSDFFFLQNKTSCLFANTVSSFFVTFCNNFCDEISIYRVFQHWKEKLSAVHKVVCQSTSYYISFFRTFCVISLNNYTLNVWPVWIQVGRLDFWCDTTTQFAGASYSELGDGLRPIMDANAFSSVSTRHPRGCAVRVLGGAQVFKLSWQVGTHTHTRNRNQSEKERITIVFCKNKLWEVKLF